MNRHQVLQTLAVTIAFAQGREVQWKNKKDEKWMDLDPETKDFQLTNDEVMNKDWRVKPTKFNVCNCSLSVRGLLMRCQYDTRGICLYNPPHGIKCMHQIPKLSEEERDRNKRVVIESG